MNTDEGTETPTNESVADDRTESPNYQQYLYPDPLLEEIVNTAIRTGDRLSVTLVVGGQAISGMLCRFEDYMEQVMADLRGLSSASDDMCGQLVKKMEGWLEEVNVPDKWDDYPFRVHLRDATTADGRRLGAFRCRIAEVNGFSIGGAA